ncbi:protein gar2 [Prunus yedoensis var. nudiflora]|uniref:Protein gar2 n=1 Tax=Prunus yedoensis var. nudiflora TaxID=2094558 RepID=A0A314ZM27_PRUYE|nr:protein gar2 [Prunus yedoensis var. nudiflora]
MVLSNRRLKQKLRETLAQSLVESVTKTDPQTHGSENPDPNSEPQSLKVLLDSATQKPRLSKREKRRKLLALRGSEAVSGSGTGGNFEENKGVEDKRELESEDFGDEKKEDKKKKKRKREEEEKNGVLSSEENEVVKEEAKKPKKKNKKKKNKKRKKEAKNEEEKKDGKLGSEEQSVKETKLITVIVFASFFMCSVILFRQTNGDVPTKVYVGGIPYYSTEDDIRSYFESCGTITEVDCLRFPDSGKFRGIAIISFKTEAAAKRALALDGAEMGELFLKIQPYKATRANKVSDFAPQIVEGYNRIYVGNLSWDITEDDLKKLFQDCKISSIHFGMDKETGEFRGYAHVNFSDSLSLMLALKLDQKVVCGRPVKISCAVPLKRAGTPSNSAPTNSSTHSITVAPTTGANSIPVATTTDAGADNTELSTVSGKIKRRTCYQCGEKGHLSSACPMASTTFSSTHSIAVTTTTSADSIPVATTTDTGADDIGLSAVSGKIKRRTCYQCGEKGHLSSACPITATTFSSTHSISIATTISTDSIPVAATTSTNWIPVATSTSTNSIPVATTTSTNLIPVATTTGADNGGLSAISGKIKRRTCYECGEKGHISSACPKKQSADNNVSVQAVS